MSSSLLNDGMPFRKEAAHRQLVPRFLKDRFGHVPKACVNDKSRRDCHCRADPPERPFAGQALGPSLLKRPFSGYSTVRQNATGQTKELKSLFMCQMSRPQDRPVLYPPPSKGFPALAVTLALVT
ncbi:hypothetical protein LB523_17490 [Mesorhizobium sp. ESP-6-4]|uniref:hypothetical protein n=1 Tax=Mesorhizobium sp. ESP-6-4 TaxID=2876624 RepID=UPI001CCED2BB|nr:hypothetical protein [Mesorhizobium sp. ESP-6-4]MBZ9660843.1 hypothetical protein [Mesorhizobium sp. ESP-6-4]